MNFIKLPLLLSIFMACLLDLYAQPSQQNNPLAQVHELYKEAQPYLATRDSAGLAFAERLEKLAAEQDDPTAVRYAVLSRYKVLKNYDRYRTVDGIKDDLELLESTRDTILSDAYSLYSGLLTNLGEFPDGLKYAFEAVGIDREVGDGYREARDLSTVGFIHDRMYELRESIKWSKQALEIALKNDDLNGQADAYNNIGIAYDELAEQNGFNRQLFDSALYYNKKSLAIQEQKKDYGSMRVDYSNIGNTYSKLGEYGMAEEYTQKSLAVPGFEERKGVTLVNLGKIYLETGRYVEARKILDSALQNTITYGTKKFQLEAYYRMHELDIKLGNYEGALKNYIQYKSIEDSLVNERKNLQVVEMNTRFKTAAQEKQLAETRADLAEQELSNRKQKMILFGGGGLVLILAMVSYLLYNQQKLKNRQLKKENELKVALAKIETQNRLEEQRLRISRDLHDNIGSQLTFIISAIGNLKFSLGGDSAIAHKLDDIGDFTTRTIRELRDTIWAMNKTQVTMAELAPRIADFIHKAEKSTEGITFKFNMDDTIPDALTFTSVEGINMYRIVQEAVNNSIKYAGPSLIAVSFSSYGEELIFTIIDDGSGFDIKDHLPGNGLRNMRKRAQEINAVFDLDSTPAGTSIKVVCAGLALARE